MKHMTDEQRARLEVFKLAVLKDVPEFLGSVELYNPQTQCYCIAGLALKNLGFNVPAIVDQYYNSVPTRQVENPYDIFNRFFGLRSSIIGCTNDSIVRASDHVISEVNEKGPEGFEFKKAPAKEVIAKVFAVFEREDFRARRVILMNDLDG